MMRFDYTWMACSGAGNCLSCPVDASVIAYHDLDSLDSVESVQNAVDVGFDQVGEAVYGDENADGWFLEVYIHGRRW